MIPLCDGVELKFGREEMDERKMKCLWLRTPSPGGGGGAAGRFGTEFFFFFWRFRLLLEKRDLGWICKGWVWGWEGFVSWKCWWGWMWE